jgi:hypothetical protein
LLKCTRQPNKKKCRQPNAAVLNDSALTGHNDVFSTDE